jgi:hypothetical protein
MAARIMGRPEVSVMHKPMTLSLVPSRDGTVYLVLDNFGGSDGPTARPIRREPTGRPSWPISSPSLGQA